MSYRRGSAACIGTRRGSLRGRAPGARPPSSPRACSMRTSRGRPPTAPAAREVGSEVVRWNAGWCGGERREAGGAAHHQHASVGVQLAPLDQKRDVRARRVREQRGEVAERGAVDRDALRALVAAARPVVRRGGDVATPSLGAEIEAVAGGLFAQRPHPRAHLAARREEVTAKQRHLLHERDRVEPRRALVAVAERARADERRGVAAEGDVALLQHRVDEEGDL